MAGFAFNENFVTKRAFFYLLMASDCTIPLRIQVEAIQDQFHEVAWSQDESYAYIIGKGPENEFLVMI